MLIAGPREPKNMQSIMELIASDLEILSDRGMAVTCHAAEEGG
jgi:hypothetical protein